MELQARVGDLIRIADKSGRARFTEFLTEAEQAVCEGLCARGGCPFALWGGWDGAGRRVLGVFAPGSAPEEDAFPVAAFSASIPKGFTLTHRDFLGALLALGIKREVVGDILIEGENAFFFVLAPAAPLVEAELRLVGRVGVGLRPCTAEEVAAAGIRQRFSESSVSVASMRLDAVLSGAAHLSRTQAARLIETGQVSVDGAVCEKATRTVADGARLSVRGKGKFLIECDGAATRKGRLIVHVKRYL